MTTDKIIEGIQILSKYYKDPAGYNMGAGHDEIFMYSTDNPVSEEDIVRLVELGWNEPEEGESWHAFV